jgi:hypothetical protein
MKAPDLRSVLLITVPEAEPAVARHRARLDSSASEGVPAHVTVLFPFMPPAAIDEPALARLTRLFAATGRFRFRLDRTAWFGTEVMWLAPRDPAPFAALTQRVYEVFPAFPPFAGRHVEVVPHLTVGHGHPVSDLRAAEAAVAPCLPIDGHATQVTLMTGPAAGGRWTTAATFPLG